MKQDLGYELDSVMPLVIQSGLLSSSATFQARSGTQSGAGQVDLTDWANVAGLVAISCLLSVESPFRPNQLGTLRLPQEMDTIGLRHLLLNGYYPAVLQTMSVLVDGVRYEIMAVEHASVQRQTRLAVRTYKL